MDRLICSRTMLLVSVILASFSCVTIAFKCQSRSARTHSRVDLLMTEQENGWIYAQNNYDEPMFSVSYDPLEPPSQATISRDLEDLLMKRSLRFLDKNVLGKREVCYLVGLEDKSQFNSRFRDEAGVSKTSTQTSSLFTLEESLSELSELAGAAGLLVAGSTYQRVARPNLEYYIGQGKTKEIAKAMSKLKCTCVIFDTELSPSQQKNLELALNDAGDTAAGKKPRGKIKVIDRTALILDIFAQHARTKEGQLQVQLALLTYRLPRLTNMWSHLERQSAGARGKSNGGVGLRGPGEKQLESDRREMKKKISDLNRDIDSVRRHRAMQRLRRRRLGLPVVALVGYTNAGKSSVLNSITSAGVYAADMLFATLDPTTRIVNLPGLRSPNLLLTDTVGFISKLPTNLVAAFRATLEEINEADVLLHVIDVSNQAWKKQEMSVLQELSDMGLTDKPIVTVWNKIDLVPQVKEQYKFLARKAPQTIAMSAFSGEGLDQLAPALEQALALNMDQVHLMLPYSHSALLDAAHSHGILERVHYGDEGIELQGKLPKFLINQILSLSTREEGDSDDDIDKHMDECINEDLTDLVDEFAQAIEEISVDDCILDTLNEPINIKLKQSKQPRRIVRKDRDSLEWLDRLEARTIQVAMDSSQFESDEPCDENLADDEWDPSKLLSTDDY